MRIKSIIALILLILFSGAYIGYQYTKQNTKDTVNNELSNLEKQLDKYKDEQNKEKMRQLELQTLQNPQLILNQFKNTGKLITYEGSLKYEDVIKEDSFWGSRELVLNLKYNVGIGIDLTTIQDISFNEKTVIIKIPKNELKIEYVELSNESKINSKKKFFMGNYTPEDIKMILDNSQTKINEYINNHKEYYDTAFQSLKDNLSQLILKIGYDKVIIEKI